MFQRALILAPHTDDGELGCGGTIARFVEEGADVHMFAFSNAAKSLGAEWEGDESVLVEEFHAACEVLGIPAANRGVIEEFDVRRFPAQRQEILQRIIELRDRIRPDVVFVPSPNDIHQDHEVVAREGLRAFKKQTILGYEEPWNNVVFETRLFVKLSETHVERKVRALRCYETQLSRGYLDEDFIRSLARTRGTQLESEYAEAFEVLRMVIP